MHHLLFHCLTCYFIAGTPRILPDTEAKKIKKIKISPYTRGKLHKDMVSAGKLIPLSDILVLWSNFIVKSSPFSQYKS